MLILQRGEKNGMVSPVELPVHNDISSQRLSADVWYLFCSDKNKVLHVLLCRDLLLFSHYAISIGATNRKET